MIWMLAVAMASEAPDGGVVLTLNAYGEHITGHVMIDADALAGLGITLFREQEPLKGQQVPLAHGVRVLGLPVGERQIQDAVKSLLYLDANSDGYLDAKDPGFSMLSLFADGNEDGSVQAGEVRALTALGIDSISRFGDIRMKER